MGDWWFMMLRWRFKVTFLPIKLSPHFGVTKVCPIGVNQLSSNQLVISFH